MFLIVPIIYLLTYFFIKDLKDFYPEEKINLSQFKRFFNKKNKDKLNSSNPVEKQEEVKKEETKDLDAAWPWESKEKKSDDELDF